MIAQVGQLARRLSAVAAIAAIGLLMAVAMLSYYRSAPLPFPTPGQQDLVVLAPRTLAAQDETAHDAAAFELDLLKMLAAELGVGIRFVIPGESENGVFDQAPKYHLASGWLSPLEGQRGDFSPALIETRDLLVQPEASLPIIDERALAGRRIHVLAGSRQQVTAEALKRRIASIDVVPHQDMDPVALLEGIAENRFELAISDQAFFDHALQLSPALQGTLEFGPPAPIAWQFADNANPELRSRVTEFLQRLRGQPAYQRLVERHFGHIDRLDRDDIARFLETTRTTLPRLRRFFIAAQEETRIDWRLLAALAYQESKWDPSATSPTGVRGIMMLTEDTADRLGVANRLDAEESIRAGARYLRQLRDRVPETTPEPDRTWLALAAYNIGPGHFNAALTIGRQLKVSTNAWSDMKRVLPLLARPQYYQRLKSGRARGGEAVILVENVRSYHDILARQEPERKTPALPVVRLGDETVSGLRPGIASPGLRLQAPTSFSIPPM